MKTPKEACKKALRRATDELGSSPTKAQYESLDISPSSTTIVRTFGSWNKAKEAAGLKTYKSPKRVETDERGQEQLYSYKDCLEAVEEVDSRHEFQRMSQSIYRRCKDEKHPSDSVIANRLGNGSWTQAVKVVREYGTRQ